MAHMIGIEDIRAARERIAPFVRRTPLIAADQLKTPVAPGAALTLKLELLQVTGSFKARGAMNRLLTTPEDQLSGGIVAASGGNHGLATARAGYLRGIATTIFLPTNASPSKIEKLRHWGAEVIVTGKVWDASNAAALLHIEGKGGAYFHPFADPAIVAGQGTLALEMLEQQPDVETVLVAIGGGGLISGVATALKALKPGIRVVGVEATGSATLKVSVDAGRNTAIPEVTTSVATLSCAQTDDRIFAIVNDLVDEIVLVDDREMMDAARWLWFEMGLASDLSGAAALAALQQGRVSYRDGEKICAIVCGAGPEALLPTA